MFSTPSILCSLYLHVGGTQQELSMKEAHLSSPQSHEQQCVCVISLVPDCRGVGAPPPLSETPCMIVSTREQLDSAARNLEGAPWVAVDVEHNSARSYFGVSCLLQLSTGDADYIVDTLALHDDMALLQPLFNNPRTLKVSTSPPPPSLTPHFL